MVNRIFTNNDYNEFAVLTKSAPAEEPEVPEEEPDDRIAAQYAAGTPVIMLYALATETTEQTTPQHLVTHKGTNVVEVVANVEPVELEVVYAKVG